MHTAAASNLGQMLQNSIADDVPLVNVVRKPEQEKLLRDIEQLMSVILVKTPLRRTLRKRFWRPKHMLLLMRRAEAS